MIAVLAIILLGAVLACWIPLARYRRSHPIRQYPDVLWAAAHHVVLLLLATVILTAILLPEEIFRRYPDQFDPKSTFIIGGVLAFVPLALFSLGLELTVTFARSSTARRVLIGVLWALSAVLLLWLASPFVLP